MAIDTNVQVFTDAELLLLTRKAIADILVAGQAYGINGRNLTRADLPELWATVNTLESRITSSGSNGDGGTALIQFDDPA
jgi:hypothetical protein